MDLPGGKAKISGERMDIKLTTEGHYTLYILPQDMKADEQALLELPMGAME